jgi:protein gp37
MAHNPNNKISDRYTGTVERHVNDCLRWTGKINLLEDQIEKPFHWKKPRRVFVDSLSDLFHESVPDHYIAAVFGVMAACQHHTFQLLTRRTERARTWFAKIGGEDEREGTDECITAMFGYEKVNAYLTRNDDRFGDGDDEGEWDHLISDPPEWPLDNVWIGGSASTQKEFERVASNLVQIPAAVRFFSFEPLVSAIDMGPLFGLKPGHGWSPCLCEDIDKSDRPCIVCESRAELGRQSGIGLVIVGGESGPGARPMHPQWVRDIRYQCVGAGIPFFFKQWGEWETYYDRDVEDPDWRRCPSPEEPLERYLNLAGGHGFHGDRVVAVRRVGKKYAGRRLDDDIWDQMP